MLLYMLLLEEGLRPETKNSWTAGCNAACADFRTRTGASQCNR